MTKISVNLMVKKGLVGIFRVVLEISINCHHVFGLVELNFVALEDRLIPIEICWLIHIKPNSGKRNQLVESIKLWTPIGWSIRVQIIDIMNPTWPNDSLIWCAVMAFHENIHILSNFYCYVIGQGNANIDKRNVMKGRFIQKISHLFWRVILLIDCEYGHVFHVI